jgi:signal transduction histidine kinase
MIRGGRWLGRDFATEGGGRRYAGVLLLLVVFATSAAAQFPGFDVGEDDEENGAPVEEEPIEDTTGAGGLVPRDVPSDLLDPALALQGGAENRFAYLFNAEVRDIRSEQQQILDSLEKLPRFTQESIKPVEFGYHSSRNVKTRPKWVQIDLGRSIEPDAIALAPVTVQMEDQSLPGYGFPEAFRIDISDDPNFKAGSYTTIVNERNRRSERPPQAPFFQSDINGSGRYIRLTATRLWSPPGKNEAEVLALGEFMVLKGARNVAAGRPVTTVPNDSTEVQSLWSRRYLTDGRTALGIPHRIEESPSWGFSSSTKKKAKSAWVQIDLEEMFTIDEIRLIPANPEDYVFDLNIGFPETFRVEVSDEADMRGAEVLVRFTQDQLANPGNNPVILPIDESYGRYVRLTYERPAASALSFALAELQVFSENTNVALQKTVSASNSLENGKWAKKYLVDGYSSRHRLTSLLSWLEAMDERAEAIETWRTLNQRRVVVVKETARRGVIWTGAGGGAAVLLLAIGMARSRRNRFNEVEKIRQQIASDLHDDIGSNLSSIALLAELGDTEAGDEELAREEFQEIKVTADKTIESMRDIVWLIRPGQESWRDLITRFRETAAQLLRAHEYNFDVQIRRLDEGVPLDFKRDLFLMFKEILNNIVRHAGASEVAIQLTLQRGQLDLDVVDNGTGFDPEADGFRAGNGLRNLQRRAESLGGKLQIRSGDEGGTTVHLTATVP